MRREDEQGHHAEGEREGVEQVEERARVVEGVGLARERRLDRGDRGATDDVAEGHTEERGWDDRADEDRRVPALAPGRVIALAAVLEGDAAQDEREEDEEQREVVAAKHRGVPEREGRERRSARDEQPHLIAVPDRSDRVDHDAAAQLVLAQEGQEHAHALVEAVEDEVADPQDRDEPEPDEYESVHSHVCIRPV